MTTALALTSHADAWHLAQTIARARPFLPKGCSSAEECFAVILAGSEMGLPPMQSLRLFHVIQGRPALSSEGMLAAAIGAGIRVEWVRSDSEVAQLTLSREGHAPYTSAFSMEDAKRAGLLANPTWRSYPAAMLRARCVSAAVRAYCPDVLGGVYTDEEVQSFGRAPAPGTAATDVEVVVETQPDPEPWRFDVELERLGWTLDMVHRLAAENPKWGAVEDWTERYQARFIERIAEGRYTPPADPEDS